MGCTLLHLGRPGAKKAFDIDVLLCTAMHDMFESIRALGPISTAQQGPHVRACGHEGQLFGAASVKTPNCRTCFGKCELEITGCRGVCISALLLQNICSLETFLRCHYCCMLSWRALTIPEA